jgi:hypothetical protein
MHIASMHLCIYASMHLCIYFTSYSYMHLCIYFTSLHLPLVLHTSNIHTCAPPRLMRRVLHHIVYLFLSPIEKLKSPVHCVCMCVCMCVCVCIRGGEWWVYTHNTCTILYYYIPVCMGTHRMYFRISACGGDKGVGG